MDEARYKTLKSKHDLLKDAFKKLYGDYETLKGDLTSKIEDYAKLHEENTHLKHSYDLLADEVSQHNQKSSKTAHSSWANPLTLIKGTGQTSSADQENYQKLNEEILSLKTRLESSIRDNDLLQVQNLQISRDLEDTKAKHSVVVTELKDRLIALESILKDLQDQSNKNETKLSQYSIEIKSLNSDLEYKLNEISNLNRNLDNLRKEHEKDLVQWRLKLSEKFKFDLRRNHFINFNNVYQNSTHLDTVTNSFSCYEVIREFVSSLSSFFNSWRSCLRFVDFSKVDVNKDANISKDSTISETDEFSESGSFTFISKDGNVQVCKNMDSLMKMIGECLTLVLENLDCILIKMGQGLFDSVQYSNINYLVENLKKFFKLQRIYLCVEEFLFPYPPSDSPKNSYKRSTSYLISLLGTFSKIVISFYFNLRSILFLVQSKKRKISTLLFMVLSKESDPGFDTSLDSSVNDPTLDELRSQNFYKVELNTVESLLENSSRNITNLIRNLSKSTNDLKELLSHRLCYPKVYNNKFLPFSGGTNQMLHLTSCLTSLEDNLTRLSELRMKPIINYLFTSLKFYSNSDQDFDFRNYSVQTHPAISYLNSCNNLLLNSQPRIKLINLEHDLHVAKKNENELKDLKLKYSDMEELLTMETQRSERYEHELESLRQTDLLESLCVKTFKELQLKYSNYNHEDSNQTEKQLETKLKESNEKVKKLSTHIKHLVKTLTNLEDSNKQLKLALELNKDQYRLAKENEDSIHLNYNEQLVLMSEHISELNNVILSSEYRIAELTQTKVSCPSCGFNNTLGSMMGVDDKGRCSSCRNIIIFSTS